MDKKKQIKKKFLAFRVTQDDYDFLNHLAEKNGISVSAIIAPTIKKFIEAQKKNKEE